MVAEGVFDMVDCLALASDAGCWDGDTSDVVIPSILCDGVRNTIDADSARRLFGL
jgi:hypothetical protein